MSIHAYVASKYDVEFHVVNLRGDAFDNMMYNLERISQRDERLPEVTFSTDDDNNWYEIDKEPLEKMLEYLKSLQRVNDKLFDEREEAVCPANYIDMISTVLAPVPPEMDFVRLEFE